jgi:hypothetical protein
MLATSDGFNPNRLPVTILGGRFAVNDVAPDGQVVHYRRQGPLSVYGLTVDGCLPAGASAPRFFFDPDGGGQIGELAVHGVLFSYEIFDSQACPAGAVAPVDPIDLGAGGDTHVTASSIMCGATLCPGLGGGGVLSFGGVAQSALPASGILPGHVTYCTDCQPHSSPCEAGGSGALAVRTGSGWLCAGGGATFGGDVTGSLPGGTLTIADSSVEPSDVNDGTDTPALGECLTKASGDQFVWAPCDSAVGGRATDIVIQASTTAIAWTMLSAVTEIYGTQVRRLAFDLMGYSQFRIVATQVVAGSSGAKLRVEYSTNGGSGWSPLESGTTTGDLAVNVSGTTNAPAVRVGAWAPIAGAAQGNVWLRLVGFGGNGSLKPSWYALRLQVK